MYVAVISDSHDNLHALREVIERIRELRVDLLIHLGDIISPFTVKLMKEMLKDLRVIAIRGNNDGDVYQLADLFNRFNWIFRAEPGLIEIGGRKLFIMHGFGSIDETVTIARSIVHSLDVDLVLYGHTHKYNIERIGHKLLLNPGETCGYLTNKITYATIDLDELRGEIHFL